MYDKTFTAIQSGKSRLAAMMLEAALASGRTVMVCRAEGNTLQRRDPRSGFTVITPLPKPKPVPVIYDEGPNWVKQRFLSDAQTISEETWKGWDP